MEDIKYLDFIRESMIFTLNYAGEETPEDISNEELEKKCIDYSGDNFRVLDLKFQIGVENGYSPEEQIKLLKRILNKL